MTCRLSADTGSYRVEQRKQGPGTSLPCGQPVNVMKEEQTGCCPTGSHHRADRRHLTYSTSGEIFEALSEAVKVAGRTGMARENRLLKYTQMTSNLERPRAGQIKIQVKSGVA